MYDGAGVRPADIRTLEDFSSLPTVDKQTLRDAFPDRVIAVPYRGRRLVDGSTSGSTGEPLRFVLDRQAVAYKIAVNLRAMELAGYRWGRDRLLQVSPAARVVGRWTQRLADRLMKRRFLEPFRPDYQSALDQFRRFRTTVLFGYTSYLRSLAECVQQVDGDVPLRLVLTTSETLQMRDRDLISRAFQVPVFDQYGSTEFGRVATEYPGGRGLLVQADVTFLEVDSRHHDASGAEGQLILTSLVNYAMPFIRYRIGDLAILASRSSDRFPAFPEIAAIDGRVHDMLVRLDGTRVVPEFVHRVLREYEEIDRYQVVQQSRGQVEIKLRLRRPLAAQQIARIRQQFEAFLGAVQVIVNVSDEFVTRAGKSPYVLGYPVVGLESDIAVAVPT